MIRKNKLSRVVLLLVLSSLAVLALNGCASNLPYHTAKGTEKNCLSDVRSEACRLTYIQDYGDHTIVVPEYSERGNSFDDRRLKDILDYVRQKSDERGVAMIVFVHGWKHNSSEGFEKNLWGGRKEPDSNLTDFRNVIAEIANERTRGKDIFGIGDRKLIGIYVGWRGASLQLDYIKNLSYWERKAVAEQFGNTGLSHLLLELDAIKGLRADTGGQDDNLMVTIGHSLGGAAVLSAVSKPLLTRLIETGQTQQRDTASHCKRGSCGIGDGVFLLNPAIEANQVMSLMDATVNQDYPETQPPLLVSLSSEADLANKIAFPVGQTVGLLATGRQEPIARGYYVDDANDVTNAKSIKFREESLDSTTVGNFPPFLTHRLDLKNPLTSCPRLGNATKGSSISLDHEPLNYCTDYRTPEECGPKRLDTTAPNSVINRKSKYNPLYFIRTDAAFMTGHNDIFNPYVVAFLAAQLGYGIASDGRPDLYHDPAKFKTEFEKYLDFSCTLNFQGEG